MSLEEMLWLLPHQRIESLLSLEWFINPSISTPFVLDLDLSPKSSVPQSSSPSVHSVSCAKIFKVDRRETNRKSDSLGPAAHYQDLPIIIISAIEGFPSQMKGGGTWAAQLLSRNEFRILEVYYLS